MSRHWRQGLAVVAAFALASALSAPASANNARATLTGNVPPWATSANFKQSVNTSDSVGFRVYLGWQN